MVFRSHSLPRCSQRRRKLKRRECIPPSQAQQAPATSSRVLALLRMVIAWLVQAAVLRVLMLCFDCASPYPHDSAEYRATRNVIAKTISSASALPRLAVACVVSARYMSKEPWRSQARESYQRIMRSSTWFLVFYQEAVQDVSEYCLNSVGFSLPLSKTWGRVLSRQRFCWQVTMDVVLFMSISVLVEIYTKRALTVVLGPFVATAIAKGLVRLPMFMSLVELLCSVVL